MKYYLIEKQRSNEGSVLFWRANSSGYTADFNMAGIYEDEDVKDYLGKSEETFAIEKNVFNAMMKTIKIVYNYSDFYSIMCELSLKQNNTKVEDEK